MKKKVCNKIIASITFLLVSTGVVSADEPIKSEHLVKKDNVSHHASGSHLDKQGLIKEIIQDINSGKMMTNEQRAYVREPANENDFHEALTAHINNKVAQKRKQAKFQQLEQQGQLYISMMLNPFELAYAHLTGMTFGDQKSPDLDLGTYAAHAIKDFKLPDVGLMPGSSRDDCDDLSMHLSAPETTKGAMFKELPILLFANAEAFDGLKLSVANFKHIDFNQIEAEVIGGEPEIFVGCTMMGSAQLTDNTITELHAHGFSCHNMQGTSAWISLSSYWHRANHHEPIKTLATEDSYDFEPNQVVQMTIGSYHKNQTS